MKKLISILSILAFVVPVVAQSDKIDSLLNDLVYNDSDPLIIPEKPVKFDFIYTGSGYNSNTFYAGREISSSMYNVSGHFYYFSSSGIYAGISGIWFDQLTPSYSSTTFSTGFNKPVGRKKHFTFRTSYSHYFFYKPDSGISYPYQNNVSLGLSFRKSWIGARISGSFLFGDDTKTSISSAVYSRFTLIKLGKYNKLYTAPEISAYFSRETVNTITTDTTTSDSGTSGLKDIFGLLNTQLYVPVGISIGNFDIEFNYSVNFPFTRDVAISYPTTSYFGMSIGYMLPIAKKIKR